MAIMKDTNGAERKAEPAFAIAPARQERQVEAGFRRKWKIEDGNGGKREILNRENGLWPQKGAEGTSWERGAKASSILQTRARQERETDCHPFSLQPSALVHLVQSVTGVCSIRLRRATTRFQRKSSANPAAGGPRVEPPPPFRPAGNGG